MKKLAIIGAGDLGKLTAYHAEDSGYTCVGFFDDTMIGKKVNDIKVFGGTNDIANSFKKGEFDEAIIAIGYKHMDFREKIFEDLKNKIPFANIIHSSCFVDPSTVLGQGIFMLPGCTIDAGVEIENNVLLNTACTVAHDTSIGSHSFLSPGVTLAGFIKIGSKCTLGIGTIVIDNIRMGDEIQTGGGSVVTRNLEHSGLYVGVPARKIK